MCEILDGVGKTVKVLVSWLAYLDASLFLLNKYMQPKQLVFAFAALQFFKKRAPD